MIMEKDFFVNYLMKTFGDINVLECPPDEGMCNPFTGDDDILWYQITIKNNFDIEDADYACINYCPQLNKFDISVDSLSFYFNGEKIILKDEDSEEWNVGNDPKTKYNKITKQIINELLNNYYIKGMY